MPGFIRAMAASLPASDLRNPALWLLDTLGGRRTRSGSEVGPDSALTLPSYYAGIRNLSEDVAKVPLVLSRLLENGGKEEATDDRRFDLLALRPNADMGAMTLREVMTAHAIGWGDGFCEIARSSGQVVGLHLIHPSRVQILRGDHMVDDRDAGGFHAAPLVYRVHDNEGNFLHLPARDVLHIRGLGSVGIRGYSICRLMAEAIGIGLASEAFGASFFGNGAAVSGVLRNPATMDDATVERLRKQFKEKYSGPGNAGKPLILEEGMEYQRIGIPPEEAQFIQTRKFQVEEMARILRIPPHKLGHLEKATFSNIESQNIDYVNDTLTPWFSRWEQEVSVKLLSEGERRRFCVLHNVAFLTRGDAKARSERQRKLFSVGAMSPNDIRDEEGLNPIENGDTYYLPSNMIRAEDAAKGVMAQKISAKGPEKDPVDAKQDSQEGPQQQGAVGIEPFLLDAAERMLTKQMRATERATKRHSGDSAAFCRWFDKFMSEQRGCVEEAFRPAELAAGTSGAARRVADWYVEQILEQLLGWEIDESPPITMTKEELAQEAKRELLGSTRGAA